MKSHIFNLENGFKKMQFRWEESLVSYGRNANSSKKMRFKKYPDSSGPGPNLHVAYITENDLSRVLNLI